MNNIIRDSFISVIRQLIAFALGGFVGWATDNGLQISGQIELIVGVVAVFIVNVGWTVVSHLLRKWKINAALLLEPNATHGELDAAVAAVPVLQRISEALTIPEREQVPSAPLATEVPSDPAETK